MKEKLINLIKKYRAESEWRWNPERGYINDYIRGAVTIYDKCADDLEGLVRHLSEASTRLDEPWRCQKCGEIIFELPCSNCGNAEASGG